MSSALIQQLALQPHPEGGYYRRIYAAQHSVTTNRGPRPCSSAIYYLLQAGDYSQWHRLLLSEETWLFQQGAPLTLWQLSPQGQLSQHTLSPQAPSLTIAPGTWFCAATQASGSDYSLCSCLVSPGFDFADFELADPQHLAQQYPTHQALIQRYCRT